MLPVTMLPLAGAALILLILLSMLPGVEAMPFGRGSGLSKKRKGSMQGRANEPTVKYETLGDIEDFDYLRYKGEQAERRSTILWFYRSLGSPLRAEWDGTAGKDGTVSIICKRMGLPRESYGKMVKRTLAWIEAGHDVRRRRFGERVEAQRMSAVEHGVAADCLREGFGVRQA